MSLRGDALGKVLGLDGAVIHMSGPVVPLTDEASAMFEEIAAGCCMGMAVYGPERCTCWEPTFDLIQVEPDDSLIQTMCHRAKCCHDCAYRLGSPERTEDEYLAEALLELPSRAGRVFACHQGMRRVVSWTHPCGIEIPAGAGDYRPAMLGTVAFKADGSPADLCAGWAALCNA